MSFGFESASYTTAYSRSLVLAVGIDRYIGGRPSLQASARGAEAVAHTLRDRFGFTIVDLLKDEGATKRTILDQFYSFRRTQPDDRVVIVFSGHGETLSSSRGNVGFAIPYDGEGGAPSTWIRISELIEGADLFKAKHVLFLIDSCYSGTAFTKGGVEVGDVVNDFHLRRCRIVCAAGEKDQPVLDSGGPRGLSPFAGHLVDALNGAAARPNGLMLARHVGEYVFNHVMNTARRVQTPRWGLVDGDGDLIFSPPLVPELAENRRSYLPEDFGTEFGAEVTDLEIEPAIHRTDAALPPTRQPPTPTDLNVSVESIRTGEVITLKVRPRASIRRVLRTAQRRLDFKDRPGPFPRYGALIDRRVEHEWRRLPPHEHLRIRAFVGAADGIRRGTSGNERLYDLGVYDGIVFYLYS